MSKLIFVFGSNLAGRHGSGAAADAYARWGAVWGEGVGLHGDSYAIPTKDMNMETMPLLEISNHISDFKLFARTHPGLFFIVTRVGCGLAGYEDADIAPMFTNAPDNCLVSAGWARWLA